MGHTPSHPRHAAESIIRLLQNRGHVAYLAGGCVRDELLGRTPSDYDIATDATPERIRALFPRASFVGAAFGVVLVTQGHHTVEVATFRSDGPYSDRRRPDSVTFSDPLSDACRRDFTINALFLDPFAAPDDTDRTLRIKGHLIDLVAGLPDLQTGVLRAVGDPETRLAEDHLRALRAVRFAARFNFTIEPATAAAIRRHASDLIGVSRERIGEELRRTLVHPSRVKGMSLLAELELDSLIFHEPTHAGPWPTLDKVPDDRASFALTLAALAIDRFGVSVPIEPVTRRWRSALMLSNAERDDLLGLLTMARDLRSSWASASVAQKKRWASDEYFRPSFVLLYNDIHLCEAISNEVEVLSQTPGGLAPTPLADGQVLINAGITPSPVFGTLLKELYDLQLEGRISTVEEAIRQARELNADKSV